MTGVLRIALYTVFGAICGFLVGVVILSNVFYARLVSLEHHTNQALMSSFYFGCSMGQKRTQDSCVGITVENKENIILPE
jgi:hypothetical protein